jgi:uncharacterized protein
LTIVVTSRHPLHLLRLNARELLRLPNTTRTVDVELPAEAFDIDDERITGDIEIHLTAVSNIDGIVVTGSISLPWQAPCRRCLTDASGVRTVPVEEVYQEHPLDAEAFEIEGDQIDLAPAVREYVLIEVPDDPLCRPDCAGICPECGTDRNQSACACDMIVVDERWAALDGLVLDDPE